MNTEAFKAFYRKYNGAVNFMTPTPVEYFETDKYYIELSKGEGIFHNVIYGVTVITKKLGDTDLSRCFASKVEAMKYIEQLNNA